MKCPECIESPDMRVIATRDVDGLIKRRRECPDCYFRMTTYEVPEERYHASEGLEDETYALLSVARDIIEKLGGPGGTKD